MSLGRIALFLIDSTNEFQKLLQADAEAAARANDLEIETTFSGNDYAAELSAIQRSLDADRPPSAVVLLPVNDKGLQRIARRAAQAGVHLFFLTPSDDDLAAVRRENPKVAVSVVCPDELETGRIQGRQFRRLVRPGGRILYVQGHGRSLTARNRAAGVRDALQGAPLELVQLDAGWTSEEALATVGGHLRLCVPSGRCVDLIGCQNDMLAQGSLEALKAVAVSCRKPELVRTPVTGCDGAPHFGQPMVQRGELRATVVLPRCAGPAVDWAARVLRGGDRPPDEILLQPESFPVESRLAAGN